MEIKKAVIRFLLLIFAFLFISCNKKQELPLLVYTSDESQLYSQAIDQLIVNRLFYFSCKETLDELDQKWMDKKITDSTYQKSAEKIRREFIEHPENVCLIYVDSSRLPGFGYERKGILQKINFPDSVFNLFGDIDTALMISDFNSVKKIKPESLVSNYAVFKNKTAIIDSNICFIGWIAFSDPYFNSDKTSAMFHFDYHCGGLCGYEGFIALKKYDGEWREIGFDKRLIY